MLRFENMQRTYLGLTLTKKGNIISKYIFVESCYDAELHVVEQLLFRHDSKHSRLTSKIP